MNNASLIPVFSGSLNSEETVLLCDARILHEYLHVGQEFAAWIKSRIEKYSFVEGQDYILLDKIIKQDVNWGGHNRVEYHITTDMAKELSMVERNEQGKATRRYFIECEKTLV